MAAFLARRVAAMILLLAIISLGVFSLLYLAPGDAALALTRGRPVPPELLAELRARYHLDDPFLTQYWIWLTNALQGDLGQSTVSGLPVVDTVRDRLPVTLFLGLYAFLITMVVGVSLGIVSALRRRSAVDRTIVGVSIAGVSMPAFVTGILLLYFFAVEIAIFPAFGPGEGFSSRLTHLTLPAIALALTQTTYVLRLTRAAMIEALEHDSVAFARARGVPMRRVVVTYALRNALVPIVTAAGMILGLLVVGAVIVEVVFSLQGLGALLFDAVSFKDVPMVQGLTLLAAASIILLNLVTDLLYMVIDPRIRYERGRA
jgi:peptide/nickel transport system permease protein